MPEGRRPAKSNKSGRPSAEGISRPSHPLTNNHKCDIMPSDPSPDGQHLGGELIITDLKQGVKNPNRVNVFINDKFSFSLDLAQVVDLGIKKGKSITETELAEYQKASEFGKLYQRALEWVLLRPRSEREVRDYLKRKLRNISRGGLSDNGSEWSAAPPITMGGRKRLREGYSEFSDDILSRLIAKGYVDDRKFAEFWVENRFVKKGVSQKRLRMELIKKGIAKDIIEEVLPKRNDEEEINKIIAKKRAKYDDDKLISYLCRQGFPYQLAQTQVREFGTD